jgi:hypothetical protein
MGTELLCTVHFENKSAIGKALLESNEIVFRGDLRLKIPLSTVKSVVSRNGELHVKWTEGVAVFELGAQADKWAHKILHPKSTTVFLSSAPRQTSGPTRSSIPKAQRKSWE